MWYDTITLYGEHCPWQRGREIVIARPITYGIAQIAMTPFATSWTSMGDIVAYDQDWRVTGVIIRNSRTLYGQFDVSGISEFILARRQERLGHYLRGHLIDWTFAARFPGVVAMSVDTRIPLERVMELSDQSPVHFRVLRANPSRIT